MKKILIFSSLLGGFSIGSFAQTFSPPTSTEYIEPVVSDNISDVCQHVSSYTYSNVPFMGSPNNFYVWGFSGINQWSNPGTGIGWKRTDPSGTVLDEGSIGSVERWDNEVALIRAGSNMLVVSAYYQPGVGHQYRVYTWTATGLLPLSGPHVLSAEKAYNRISIDAHDLNRIAITYHEDGQLKVTCLSTTTGSLVEHSEATVFGATNAKGQDIAIGHYGVADQNIVVRIAYVNQTGAAPYNVRVISYPFIGLTSGGTATFTLEDASPLATMSIGGGMVSSILNIDCPDHNNDDNWTYVIQQLSSTFPTTSNIKARIKTSSGINTYDLTLAGTTFDMTASTNVFPSLAYDPTGTRLHFMWTTGVPGATSYPTLQYIGVRYSDTGVPIAPIGDFMRVSYFHGIYSINALSKQNDHSSNLFAAYAVDILGARDYRHKIQPWSMTSYRPGQEPDEQPAQTNNLLAQAAIVPNPFSTSFKIVLPMAGADEMLEVNVYDISGRLVLNKKGTIEHINSQIEVASLGSGNYTVNVRGLNSTLSKSFMAVKDK